MLDDQKLSPALLGIRAIDIIYIRECSACARCKDRNHADNPYPEELLFQAEDNSADFCGIDLAAEPINTKNGCSPAAGSKVMNESDDYGKCLFHDIISNDRPDWPGSNPY